MTPLRAAVAITWATKYAFDPIALSEIFFSGSVADADVMPIIAFATSASSAACTQDAVSYSGRGVVRNYGDSNKTSPDPMPSLYDRTCYFDSTSKWNFKSWVPQAVVINLGTNDFSTHPYPDSSIFEAAYGKLIDRVRTLYPNVTVFCVIGPMVEEPCEGYIRDVVQRQQKLEGRDRDVFFVDIPREIMADFDWGCEMHPNIYGSMKMAGLIVPEIKLRMNW